MPEPTVSARDAIRKARIAGDISMTAADVKRKVALLERIQPGGIVGATAQTELVPFGLEPDDEEPV